MAKEELDHRPNKDRAESEPYISDRGSNALEVKVGGIDTKDKMASLIGYARQACNRSRNNCFIIRPPKTTAVLMKLKQYVMSKQMNLLVGSGNGKLKLEMSVRAIFCGESLRELSCEIVNANRLLHREHNGDMQPDPASLPNSNTDALSVEATREEERKRIGQEIHDDLGGALSYLKLGLTRLKDQVAKTPIMPAMELENRIQAMVKAADQAMGSVRRISMELKPIVIDERGLAKAVEWLLMEFESRTGIRCRFHNFIGIPRLDQSKSVLLFRIVQEALVNISRHAQATQVEVAMKQLDNDAMLSIKDNGIGLPPQDLIEKGAMGLRGMRERARLAGGRLSITSHPHQGTMIRVTIPAEIFTRSNDGREHHLLTS